MDYQNFWKIYFKINKMKIEIELFGASRDFSDQNTLKLEVNENSTIKDIKKKILDYLDKNFNGNENFKKIVNSSAFCSKNNKRALDFFYRAGPAIYNKDLKKTEKIIFATFFAGSTPTLLIPRFCIGSRKIPSLLPISIINVLFGFNLNFSIYLLAAFSKPSRIPPTPANKSINLYFILRIKYVNSMS